MTKKSIVGGNKDFEILRIDSLASICCGKAPFSSFCIRKKGSLQQLNLDEEEFKNLKELMMGLPGLEPGTYRL